MRIAVFERDAFTELTGEGRTEAILSDLPDDMAIHRLGVCPVEGKTFDTGKARGVAIMQGDYDDED